MAATFFDYMKVVRHFTTAIAFNQTKTTLVAGMLGVGVVSMNELSPEELEEVKKQIDYVRVLR